MNKRIFTKKNAPLVSVMILTYNKRELLRKCLESVATSNYPNLEFVVSDNASTDGTEELVKQTFKKLHIKYARLKINEGVPGGFNNGVRHSKGKYVMFLSNDTTILPETITTLVQLAENDESIGLVAPKVVQMKQQKLIHDAGNFLTPMGMLYHYGIHQSKNDSKYQQNYYIFCTDGAGFLVRKKTLSKSGLHNEDFSLGYYEDTDLCHRIWLSGYKIVYEPKSVINHLWAATTTPNNPNIWFWYQRNLNISFLTNFSLIWSMWFLFWMNLIFVLLFIVRVLRGNFTVAMTLPKSYFWLFKNWGKIMTTRKTVQTKRAVSDWQLFKNTLVIPHISALVFYLGRKHSDGQLPKRVMYTVN